MTRPATPLRALALAAVNLGFLLGLGRGLAEVARQGHLEHGLGRLAVVALPRSLGAAMLGCALLLLGVALVARFVAAQRDAGPAWRRLGLLALGVALLLPLCSRLAGPVLDDLYLASEEQPLWRTLSGAARLETTWAALLVVAAVGLRALVSRWRPRTPTLPARARRGLARLGAPGPALAAGLATLALTAGVALDRHLAPPAGPNLVLIVVDTLRADHLGVYGYSRDVSPHIDALAADGVVFRNAQSPAPWTTPSLASVLSGRHPTRLGFVDRPLRLPPDLVLLTELLRARNYRTHAIVSNLFASSAVGFEQGFDGFDEDNAQGHLHVSSASVTAKALAFLDGHARQPFFLFLHYFDPHYAYRLHPPDDYPDYAGRLHDGMPIVELRAQAPQLGEGDARYLRALYDSEIRFTDRHLGAVFERLRELGLYEDALIVFLADHGEEFLERGDHWIGHTRTLYEEQLRVPLILKLPGGRGAGTRVDARVSLVDVAPTVLALLGLAFPGGYALDGVALDPERAASRLVVAETRRWANLRAVYEDAWKLIRDLDSGRVELYRLDQDPGERVNLAASHPEPRQRLEQALQAWGDAMGNGGAPVDEGAFTPEEIEQLRSLGYVE